jgi:hypothetical protein
MKNARGVLLKERIAGVIEGLAAVAGPSLISASIR